MAERPASERTEQPTPERLKKAREEGQVAQSQEVPSALVIAALLIVLALTSGWTYRWFTRQLESGLSFSVDGPMSSGAFAALLQAKGLESLVIMTPFLLAATVASVVGSILVGGWTFTAKGLKLDLSRLSLARGLKSLFSLRLVVQALVSIAKLAVILCVAWWYLAIHIEDLLSLHWSTPLGVLCIVGRLILGLGGRIAVALLAIAAADMLYQRWNFKRQFRMTRTEVKEERKQHEVSPEVRARIRAVQMALARKRMLQEVPKADVVVTNPTHYAVALRYDAEAMDAPKVVAKGADFLCEKIKEIAKEHNVPIVERPELARALYSAVQPGETVPEALFVAVAELLAMIYRLRKRNRAPWRGGNRQ